MYTLQGRFFWCSFWRSALVVLYATYHLRRRTLPNTHFSGKCHKKCRNLLGERRASSEQKDVNRFVSFKKNDYLWDFVSKVITFENTQINLVFAHLFVTLHPMMSHSTAGGTSSGALWCRVTKNRVGEKRSGFVPAFVLLGMMLIWPVDKYILGNFWLSCWL